VAAAGPLRIGPLRNLPVLRDLAVDMTPFFEKWQRAEARFEGGLTRRDPPLPVLPDSPARREADLAIECINCGVCHAACEVVGWDPAYVGPAALNRAWSLARDERHSGQAALRAAVNTVRSGSTRRGRSLG
jgi:fumarate reductase iron-sulfur subunit